MTAVPTIAAFSVSQSRASALNWIAAHVDTFAPIGQPERFAARNKPLMELLLLLTWILRNPVGAESQDSVSCLTARLGTVAGLPAVRNRPIRNSNDLLLRAGLCGVLAATGQRDPFLDSLVQRSIDSGVLDHAERLPYHILEEATFLDWGGFAHRLPAIDGASGAVYGCAPD